LGSQSDFMLQEVEFLLESACVERLSLSSLTLFSLPLQ
jgi:hypothetical protein